MIKKNAPRSLIILVVAGLMALPAIGVWAFNQTGPCYDYNSTLYERHERTALRGFGIRSNSSVEDFEWWMWSHVWEDRHLHCFIDRFKKEEYFEGTYKKGNETYILLSDTGLELLNATTGAGDQRG